jgi:hypothetical protein
MSKQESKEQTDLRMPFIGETVIYKPTSTDAIHFRNWKDSEGGLPAVVVKVHNATCVNLKVIDDGPGDGWKTSVVQGDEPGKWNWLKKNPPGGHEA